MFFTLNQLFLHPFNFANVPHHGENINNFDFFDQIFPKSVFSVQKR